MSPCLHVRSSMRCFIVSSVNANHRKAHVLPFILGVADLLVVVWRICLIVDVCVVAVVVV